MVDLKCAVALNATSIKICDCAITLVLHRYKSTVSNVEVIQMVRS